MPAEHHPQLKKTRFAPTPSGYLHLGNILSFAITATLAEKHSATVLLRIDDQDRERTRQEYVLDIFDTLNFMELPWHEGPRSYEDYKNEWSQIHRTNLYDAALKQLVEQNEVFACSCSRSQKTANSPDGSYSGTCKEKKLPLDTADTCWRLRTDDTAAINVQTPEGIVTGSLSPELYDFIVRKRDGYASYQLASMVDDLHFGIDLVVRGMDLWPSTVAQCYLAGRLNQAGFSDITFYHHSLLTGANGEKLSKSAGDTSVHQLRMDGKKPAEIYRMIAGLLGAKSEVSNWQELGAVALSALQMAGKD